MTERDPLRAAALISSLSGEGPCPMLLEIQDQIIADQSLKANKRAEAPTGLDLTRFLPICPQEELSASQSLLSSAMGQPAIWLPADAFLLASNGQSSYLVHKVDEFYQQNRKYGELHPLIPLIQAWHRNRPRSGTPNTKDRSRILPETLAMVATEDRRAGHLFMPAAHVDPADQRGQAVLPGFERENIRGPALPLALYDLGVGPSQSPGRGAPLPLRLFVESVLAVSQQDRRSGKPTDLNISLRELLSRLYPGQRTPRPTEYWPRIMQAVHALDSDEARIPILDPDTGRHEMRRIVSVGGIPRGAGHLDDNIRIIVDLPRGSEHGPQVSPNLGKWGLKSAPGYRLLLNLAYAWHDVGRTLTPVGKGKNRRWVRSYDPSRYEKFTDNYLIDLAFPTSARAHRKLLAQDMRKAVTALVEAGEIQVVDGKLLPPKSEKECR